jgi:hypothetical protein
MGLGVRCLHGVRTLTANRHVVHPADGESEQETAFVSCMIHDTPGKMPVFFYFFVKIERIFYVLL